MPPLLLLGLAWLVGLALARLPDPRLGAFWLVTMTPLMLLGRRWLPLPWPLVLAALVVTGLGLWRAWPVATEPPPALPPGITAVRGTLIAWPRAGEYGRQAVVLVDAIEVGGGWRPLTAALAADLPLYPAVGLGDHIEAQGRVRGLADLDEASRRTWLRRAGLAGQLAARRVAVLATGALDTPAAWRGASVRTIEATLNRSLPIPVAGLAAGLLIGERSGLPREVRDAFTTTGTAHLLAVSGWNVTLVVASLAWVARRLRLGRHPIGVPFTLAAIAGYAWLAGGEPTVIRAALMGGLVVVALALGRSADPLVALVLAAAVMAGLWPVLLVDLGFQLSFLATLGLLTALPPLAPLVARLPRPTRWVAEGLAATLAAQVAVEPLLAYTFGRLAPSAPFINLLVAPLVPLVMAGGAAVVVLGLPAASFGWPGIPVLTDVAAWLTTLAGRLLLAIVEAGGRLPLAGLTVPPPPLPVVLTLYALLASLAGLLVTPEPVAVLRRVGSAAWTRRPALGLAGLALAAGLVWLALLHDG